jgi:hypothetical protein
MSTNRFPQMLYRLPATQPDAPTLQDGRYDTRIVHDEEAHGAALADGWHEDHGQARQAHDALLAARPKPRRPKPRSATPRNSRSCSRRRPPARRWRRRRASWA